jgi:hypothetical protein
MPEPSIPSTGAENRDSSGTETVLDDNHGRPATGRPLESEWEKMTTKAYEDILSGKGSGDDGDYLRMKGKAPPSAVEGFKPQKRAREAFSSKKSEPRLLSRLFRNPTLVEQAQESSSGSHVCGPNISEG